MSADVKTTSSGCYVRRGRAVFGRSVRSRDLRGLQWRSIGPLRGGRSIACAGSPSRPNEYYFGAVGGGLWKTTDGGLTWRPVTDGQLHSSSVGAVAVSRIESRHRLHRDGRDRAARQHHAGRRRLQIDRRRQDVEAHGPRRYAGDLAHPRASDESRHRVRRGVRPPVRPERRARRFPLQGRRQDLAEGALSGATMPARSISAWIRTIPTCSSPRSGTRTARHGA